MRIDHLVLTVRDIAATCDFYQRVLGMEVVTFGQGRIALHFGTQKINLHQAASDNQLLVAARPTPGSGDLCFISETPVAKWIERLNTCGVALEEGPVKRTGALGPIESVYFRDPDGNLIEVSNRVDVPDDIAPLRAWLREWHARVRARDFAGGRAMCAPEMFAFGTYADFVDGIEQVMERQWKNVWPNIRDFTIRVDEARGAITGDTAWVAAAWDSLGVRPDGSTFSRPGRLTIILAKRDGRWLATHTHFSLAPEST